MSFEPWTCLLSSLFASLLFILAEVPDFYHVSRPFRLYFDLTFFHLHSVWLPSWHLGYFQMMIHIINAARWVTKGFQYTLFEFCFFFALWLVMIICRLRCTALGRRPWRSHSGTLWLGMLPVVIRSRFSGPPRALVKQRWVNFILFTLCVSSLAFRVTSGSDGFYGSRFDSHHDSDSPTELKAYWDSSVLHSEKTFH